MTKNFRMRIANATNRAMIGSIVGWRQGGTIQLQNHYRPDVRFWSHTMTHGNIHTSNQFTTDIGWNNTTRR